MIGTTFGGKSSSGGARTELLAFASKWRGLAGPGCILAALGVSAIIAIIVTVSIVRAGARSGVLRGATGVRRPRVWNKWSLDSRLIVPF